MNFKKLLGTTVLSATLLIPTTALAETGISDAKSQSGYTVNADTMEKIKIKKSKNFDGDKIKEGKYFFIHNNGEPLSIEKVNEIIPGEISYELAENQPADEAQKLYGVGLFKDNGTLYSDYIFDERDVVSLNHLSDKAKYKAKQKLDKAEKAANQVSLLSANATYSDSYEWTFEDDYNPGTTMGTYTSYVEYRDYGNPYTDDPDKSVWDVKYFNNMTNVNGYQNKEVVTRSSMEGYGAQELIDYEPSSNQSSLSGSASLGGGFIPSYSWSVDDEAVSVINDSSTVNDYGRWIFDVSLGSNNAIYTLTTEPGIRATNTSGDFAVKHSHRVEYYKNLSANDYGYTGVVTAVKPD